MEKTDIKYKCEPFDFEEYEHGYFISCYPHDWHVEGEKVVARINISQNRLYFSHGYYPPNHLGKILQRWAERNNILTNKR